MKVLVRIHAGRNFVSYFFIFEASFIAEGETIHWGSQANAQFLSLELTTTMPDS